MFRKLGSWFSGLSKVRKAGVILVSLFVVGAALGPKQPQANNAKPDPSKATQSTQITEKFTPETKADVVETQTTTETQPIAPKPKPQSSCDPNYTPCVPNVSYDLDCPDIGFRVTVIGYDHHGFDGNDNDGLGCESY